MPEPNNETELEVLRRTNKELTEKSKTRKLRIIALEKDNAELQTKLGEATASLRHIQVDAPLQDVARDMSPVPELWKEQLAKHYKIELVGGKLTLLTKDDKPVINKDGKVVSLLDRVNLVNLLCDGDDERAKTFRAITIGSKASAGHAPSLSVKKTDPSASSIQIGARFR